MCGLVGFWQARAEDAQVLRCRVGAMADSLAHRGPDGSGTWCDSKRGVAFGHRRLAILDLSEAGSQPMASADGRYVVTYNGEIYNHADLRRDASMAGYPMRGRSDTETLLAVISRWGLTEALPRLDGMFAFALWDRHEEKLHLVRDRFGIKPMYWGISGGVMMFGSELKAVAGHPRFSGVVDRSALTLFLRHGYIPDPACIYRGFEKLAPGTVATFDGVRQPRIRTWWSARERALEARARPLRISSVEVAENVDRILRKSVQARLASDVPLGAFLSGGIDSSLVVALMQRQNVDPVRTFTIGFTDRDFDESRVAERVAKHFGTRHTTLRVDEADACRVIPDLARCWDEPFADSSQIPTLLLSRLTRNEVTVALSGDGGDELFGGYRRYRMAARFARLLRIPRRVRHSCARVLRLMPASCLRGRPRQLANYLASGTDQELYRQLISHWPDPASIVCGGEDSRTPYHDRSLALELHSVKERMMLLDTTGYLPGDILAKVDRASMAAGLEVRVPLLDHRLFELAWRLPEEQRIGPQGKQPLRDALARYAPRQWFERTKKGFSVPLGAWLRGPLRDWAEDLLDFRKLRDAAMFEPKLARGVWERHLSGRVDHKYAIWDLLVFQAWHAAESRISRPRLQS